MKASRTREIATLRALGFGSSPIVVSVLQLGLIRKAIWDSLDANWTEQLYNERRGQRVAGKSDDFREGVQAFLQKRPAEFQGR